MNYIFRIVLGIFASAAAGFCSLSILYALFFGFMLPSLNFYEFVSGAAFISFFSVVAVIPGILILFILDQLSSRFRHSRFRPVYAGLIGVVVIGAWSLFFGGSLLPISVSTFILPIASFISGAVFALTVVFQPPINTGPDAAAGP